MWLFYGSLFYFSLFAYKCEDLNCTTLDSMCASNTIKTCCDCIRTHPCCMWCYQEDFHGSRCFTKGSPTQDLCDSNHIEDNFPTSVNVMQQPEFSDVEMDKTAVQLSPHEVKVKLRYDEPVNVTVKYRPAKNYLLELYYLMDLTKSMEPDLLSLQTLGSELTELLRNLTDHYRIAFGSYIDKPEMPYYRTDPLNFNNPCFIGHSTCDKAYLFKHRLNFTNDVKTFIEKVRNSVVSANSDDPEGGMQAVMQILACGETLGWSNNSRKLILVATEGTMHLAGDGLLGGFVERDTSTCRVQSDGYYNSQQHYDYPSIEEVYYKLKEKKTNMIVAAKDNAHHFYAEMEKLINETLFVGKLENKSANVLELVRKGYYAFMRKVNLLAASNIDGLQVDFFADCDGEGTWERKHFCTNAEEGKEMEFQVQLSLNQYQLNSSAILNIEESNIHEKVEIHLEFVGSMCGCKNLSPMQKECKHGMLNCRDCLCEEGWTGESCSEECKTNNTKCRYEDEDGMLSLTCSGNGECRCSKCHCSSARFQGPFCEYECPYDRRLKQSCGGHGTCLKGECICDKNYTGESCTCHESTENCDIPGTNSTCNRKGRCECNKCICEKGYSGKYCDLCIGCNGLCTDYEHYIHDHVVNNLPQKGDVYVEINENLSDNEIACVHQYDTEDGTSCKIFYNYKIRTNRTVVVKATDPKCSKPMAAGIMIGTILGTFLALTALIVLAWKVRNVTRDRAEFAQFKRNLEYRHIEANPIYKDPVVRYKNPMGNAASSSDEEVEVTGRGSTSKKFL